MCSDGPETGISEQVAELLQLLGPHHLVHVGDLVAEGNEVAQEAFQPPGPQVLFQRSLGCRQLGLDLPWFPMPPLVGHCQDLRGLNRSGEDPLLAVPDGLFHFQWRIGMRLSGSCRTKQKLLQGLSSELQIRLLQRLWLGAEYPCKDQVVGVRGHQDMVTVRRQPHDSCPRSRVKDHRIRVGNLVLFDPFQAACHEDFPVRLHWRKSKVMQNQLDRGWYPQEGRSKRGREAGPPHHHDPLEPGAKSLGANPNQATGGGPQNPAKPRPEKRGGEGASPEREKTRPPDQPKRAHFSRLVQV